MDSSGLLAIIRDFANYLSSSELQEFLSLNGYLDDSEDATPEDDSDIEIPTQ